MMSYEYETIADIIRLSEENNISFGDVVMRSELEQYDRSEKEIVKEIKHRLSIFEASIHDGMRHLQRTQSNMSGGDAARLMERKPLFMSETAYKAMSYAIAVNEANAKMFRIVACPTAGGFWGGPSASSTNLLGINPPPYFDIVHFDQAAEVFNRHPLKFVNCVNSIGNGMYIEDESVVIRPKNGFGGIGGEYIKPTALANVHAFYQRLNPSIQIIGTGGVYTGRDAFEHILCGASMVQIGTALHQQGVEVFERVSLGLKAIMAKKGYEKLEDFKGKLKYLG